MFKSLKELVGAAAPPDAPGERRARRGGAGRAPLPEVSEVDWCEWESSVMSSELDALFAQSEPPPSDAKAGLEPVYAKVSSPPEVREVAWSEWEDSVLGEGKHRRARSKSSS